MRQRKERLEEFIRQEVSTYLIEDKIKDPRITAFVTVMRVILNSDFSVAKVYVSIYGEQEEVEQTMEGLLSSEGFVRSMLGRHIKIKSIPEVRFVLDHSLENTEKVNALLSEIKEQ